MSQTFTFVVDDNLTILNIYYCPENCVFKDQYTHVVLPDNENPLLYSPIRNDDGSISLIKDPVKMEKFEKSKFEPVRRQRNKILTESDWTQARDSPLSQEKQDEWAQYRQSLRDLPITVTDATNVTWPTPPS